ncbi:MAG: osmotically inducible protein OsmC [Deltaproteobacteria bacterium SG8_13]|nr:MAG: osmotically inducible protein OsmC [Deltaproteobacteria bacterium SG8_13]
MSVQIQVQVNQAGPSASEGFVRDHSITMDRPEAKGGANNGPMGGEVLLMGLGGCFMSNLLAAVAAREAAVSDIALTIVGTLDNAPPRYTAIEMHVKAKYSDSEEMSKLITIAERGCIVANTLKASVDLHIRLAE